MTTRTDTTIAAANAVNAIYTASLTQVVAALNLRCPARFDFDQKLTEQYIANFYIQLLERIKDHYSTSVSGRNKSMLQAVLHNLARRGTTWVSWDLLYGGSLTAMREAKSNVTRTAAQMMASICFVMSAKHRYIEQKYDLLVTPEERASCLPDDLVIASLWSLGQEAGSVIDHAIRLVSLVAIMHPGPTFTDDPQPESPSFLLGGQKRVLNDAVITLCEWMLEVLERPCVMPPGD